MPLPISDKNTEWPPKDIKPYIDQATTAMAWWSGDRLSLMNSSGVTGDTKRRRFWQRRQTGDTSKATAQLHAPLVDDIAAVSADLLFGDPVGLTISDDANPKAQQEIEFLEDALGLANTFLEGAETAAASGGTYLRCAWDTNVADHGLLQTYDQQHAVPDFTYGMLAGVTLWEDVWVDGATVWRHLERHERGVVLHGLYEGTKFALGNRIPLTALPQTKDIPDTVALPGRLSDRLLVSYVPNVKPNKLMPSRPIGRADWAGPGFDDFLDAVDETWTSLMRDIRLGQAHVFVPQDWLKAAGGRPGQTKTLDMDTEIFTGLNMPDNSAEGAKLETYQANIRVEDHINGLLALTERIVSSAGYAPQTFGLKIEGRAEAGTALRIREKKTDRTQGRKRRYWQPGIRESAENLLLIGQEIFRRPGLNDSERVVVTWPESETDPAEQAIWINTLRTAQAMSIENAVKVAQPDLDGDALTEEVARIKAENQVADPAPIV